MTARPMPSGRHPRASVGQRRYLIGMGAFQEDNRFDSLNARPGCVLTPAPNPSEPPNSYIATIVTFNMGRSHFDPVASSERCFHVIAGEQVLKLHSRKARTFFLVVKYLRTAREGSHTLVGTTLFSMLWLIALERRGLLHVLVRQQ